MKKTEMSSKINEQQLKGIKTDLQTSGNKLAEVEKSQTFINSQYESQSKRHDTILADHAKLQTNLACLSDGVTKLKKDLKNEKISRIKEAQYRQNDKLEISGIPIKKGEDCKKIVIEITKHMNLNISLNDIDIAHCPRRGNIINVFMSRQARELLWCNKRNLKGFTIRNLPHESQHDSYGKPQKRFIFIQEALTFYYKHLFYLAREKCKELNLPIKQVFAYKGTIKVFINSQKTIDILCEDDIQKIN